MKFPKVISIHCGPKKTQRCQPFHGYNSTRCWVQSNPPEQTSVLASYAEVCSALFGQTIEFFTSKDASQQPSTLVHNSNVLIFLTQMSGGASLNFKTIDIWPRESPFMLYPQMQIGYRLQAIGIVIYFHKALASTIFSTNFYDKWGRLYENEVIKSCIELNIIFFFIFLFI